MVGACRLDLAYEHFKVWVWYIEPTLHNSTVLFLPIYPQPLNGFSLLSMVCIMKSCSVCLTSRICVCPLFYFLFLPDFCII